MIYRRDYNTYYDEYNGNRAIAQSIDLNEMRRVLTLMAEYGDEHSVNMFEKVVVYYTYFDEYDANGTGHYANYALRTTQELYRTLADEFAERWGGWENLSTFRKELLDVASQHNQSLRGQQNRRYLRKLRVLPDGGQTALGCGQKFFYGMDEKIV